MIGKLRTVGAVALLATLLLGCATPRDRDFFAADGIVVEAPQRLEDGTYRLPVAFTTAIAHSGLEIYKVNARVDGGEIVLSARYGLVREGPDYEGSVILRDTAPGEYQVVYRDRDGSRHSVAVVALPE